jgi:hypothetical protein
MNITNDFSSGLMNVVARRIARLDKVDKAAALADYDQAVGAMSADEKALFKAAIIYFAAEIGASSAAV